MEMKGLSHFGTKFGAFYAHVASGNLGTIEVARLDFFFWGGGCLPNLSINYIAMSKDMDKRFPQLYCIKMKISYDLGFISIGVAMAT